MANDISDAFINAHLRRLRELKLGVVGFWGRGFRFGFREQRPGFFV